jgi:hypothetical protein
MQITRGTYATVRTVTNLPIVLISKEELATMALFVVLKFIRDDANNLVMPKKIAMIKELRDVVQGSVTVRLPATDWLKDDSPVGLKEAKDAIDSALIGLGVQD